MTSTDERTRYIDGLRLLATVLEQHPEVPLPFYGEEYSPLLVGFFGAPDEARERMAAAVRALPCAFTKNPTDDWLNLNGQLSGLHIRLYAARDAVCTRRVTGTEEREVEEEVTPAVTRTVTKQVEVVEWDCGPVLGSALNESKPAAVTG